MVTFESFLPNALANNLTVQRSLRDIDTGVLATALVDLPRQIQDVFYRNMSKRACEILREEIISKHGIEQSKVHAAKELLIQLLNKYSAQSTNQEGILDSENPPRIAVDSPESIISTFRALASYVGRRGLLPLEHIENTISHPIMRKGIEFLVDGWDPMMIRAILEKYIDSHLLQMKASLQMIVEGIDSLGSKDVPAVTEQKLRAYVLDTTNRG